MQDEISLENVLRRCGAFGRYQLIHYILLSLITMGSGIIGLYYVFGAAEPSFRCRLPSSIWFDDDQFEPINATHQHLIDRWLSPTSKCEDVNGSICADFLYDCSVFERTFAEDTKFVCSQSVKKTWLSTVYQVGGCSVLLSGWISDKIGRRKMIQVSITGLFAITVLTQLLLQFVNMTANVKFALLLINQLVSSLDAYTMVFLLLMELTSSSHTSLAGSLSGVTYTFGEVLVAIFAYIVRDWLNLKWLTTGFFVFILCYLHFVPQSPYWLFSQKKYDQLEACLRKIATTNGRLDAQWFPHYVQLIEDPRIALRSTKNAKRTNKGQISHFLPRLSIGSFVAFITTLLYIKSSYDLGAMNDTVSPHWNIIIGAVVESIGYVTASALITTRLGRKYTLMIYSLFTAACVLAVPFISQSYPAATTVISQIGKLTISGAVGIAWVYIPELFPTSMRGVANGIFVSVGRGGANLAPIIDAALDDKYIKITFYVYSAMTLVMVGAIFLLPETRNRSFDDGEDDGDIIQIHRSDNDNYGTAMTQMPMAMKNNKVDVLAKIS